MMAMKKTSILMVCMGNICRSPTAEAVLRQRVQLARLEGLLEIDSAGTHRYHIGHAPDRRSIAHGAKRGYALADLRARQLQENDFQRFDLLLAMDQDNLAHMQAICPAEWQHKLHLLMEFAPAHKSLIVPDPYYGESADFEIVLDYCEAAVDGLLAHLYG